MVDSSNGYWKRRETENLKQNLKTEEEYLRTINGYYDSMLDNIQKEINGFYGKYARAEGITLAEAKKRVSKLDMEAYERKAARYVKEKNFSEQANEEMRLYNATMKINRLELLKANIGLELVDGFDGLQKYFDQILTERTLSELNRQAGILGKTIQNNAQAAHAIVNASFHNAKFSDRIWMYQGMMKAELEKLLQTGLIQGKNPRELARHLTKLFGVSKENAERLMRTELARVQAEAQKQSFERNGFTMYEFVALGSACEICRAIDGKHFEVKKMMPGENAPPMHPRCRCSTAGYMDSIDYAAWIDSYEQHKMTFVEWINQNSSNVITPFNTKEDIQVHSVGKINRDIYKCVTEDIATEEVIITDNQMRHILDRHPDAYKEVVNYLSDIIREPDFIIEDKHENTGLVIKKVKTKKEYAQMVLSICTPNDDSNYKNSVISCWEISERRLQNYLRNKRVLYKKE